MGGNYSCFGKSLKRKNRIEPLRLPPSDLSEPRPSKTGSDILRELEEEGVVNPLVAKGGVAFDTENLENKEQQPNDNEKVKRKPQRLLPIPHYTIEEKKLVRKIEVEARLCITSDTKYEPEEKKLIADNNIMREAEILEKVQNLMKYEMKKQELLECRHRLENDKVNRTKEKLARNFDGPKQVSQTGNLTGYGERREKVIERRNEIERRRLEKIRRKEEKRQKIKQNYLDKQQKRIDLFTVGNRKILPDEPV